VFSKKFGQKDLFFKKSPGKLLNREKSNVSGEILQKCGKRKTAYEKPLTATRIR